MVRMMIQAIARIDQRLLRRERYFVTMCIDSLRVDQHSVFAFNSGRHYLYSTSLLFRHS
jgi:hypothetical protein